jgi:hypothetical protein
MQVGEVKRIDGRLYVVINIQGTLEKLNAIKWYALLYLEIMQGLNRFMPLPELRAFIKKYQK